MNKLTAILNKINKKGDKTRQTGENLLVVASAAEDLLRPKLVPCNVPEINRALNGGFAKGTMHLVAGEFGSGKTAVCMSVMKALQDEDPEAFVLYVQTEPPFPWALAEEIGLDRDRLIVMSPLDYGEELIDAIYEILYDSEKRTVRGILSGFVFDSLNNTIPKRAIDAEDKEGAEKADVGSRALMLTKFMERMQGRGMLRAGTLGMVIAQERDALSGYPEAGSGLSGQISTGKAAKFNCKTITTLRRKIVTDKVAGKTTPVRQIITATIMKNNITGKPAVCEYTYDYKIGLDNSKGLMEQGLDLGIITKPNQKTYAIDLGNRVVEEELKKSELPDWLRANPGVKDELAQRIRLLTTSSETEQENEKQEKEN